jgi:hypothetical protein
MKSYTLKTIREHEAPRPTEDFLRLDNIHPQAGVPMYLTQDPTKDSYIRIECPDDKDVSVRLQEINGVKHRSPIKPADKDGIIVLENPPSQPLREGATVDVRIMGGDTHPFDTLKESEVFTDNLEATEPDKGYELIDKIDGKPSIIFGGRASFEKVAEPESGESSYRSPVIANIPNDWGREQ